MSYTIYNLYRKFLSVLDPLIFEPSNPGQFLIKYGTFSKLEKWICVKQIGK